MKQLIEFLLFLSLISLAVCFKASKESDEKERMMGCWGECKSKCVPKFYSLEPCVDDCKANKCDMSTIEQQRRPKRVCNAICRKVCAEKLPKPDGCLSCYKTCRSTFKECKDTSCKNECPPGLMKRAKSQPEQAEQCKTCLKANCGAYKQ